MSTIDHLNRDGPMCIVSVVTNPEMHGYVAGLARIRRRLFEVGYEGSYRLWTGYPPGSPSHGEHPYGFKVYAILEAVRAGYEQVVWLDSEAFPVKDLGPASLELAEKGVISISGYDKLGAWCSDECLEVLGITREQSFDGSMWVQAGKVYAFDFGTRVAWKFFDAWTDLLHRGAFRGYAINSAANTDSARQSLGHRPTGFVSNDPRVFGHRHDEVAAGYLVSKLGIPSGEVTKYWYAGWSHEAAARPGVFFCGHPGHEELPR